MKIKRTYGLWSWLALLPFEVAASFLAYWTLGWSSTAELLIATIIFNFIFLVIALVQFRVALILAVMYGMLIVGYQVTLGVRWAYVYSESKQIVNWAYSEQSKAGVFPEDLGTYSFKYPEYKGLIHYDRSSVKDRPEFSVSYHVGTQDTYHYYHSKQGWGYVDD